MCLCTFIETAIRIQEPTQEEESVIPLSERLSNSIIRKTLRQPDYFFYKFIYTIIRKNCTCRCWTESCLTFFLLSNFLLHNIKIYVYEITLCGHLVALYTFSFNIVNDSYTEHGTGLLINIWIWFGFN